MRRIPLYSQFSMLQRYHQEFLCIPNSPHSSQNAENSLHCSPCYYMKNNAENSLCYGWDAENWKCWKILHVIAGTWRFENAEIFSTLSPCYDWNADIMRRFIRIPVQILPSTFSPHFFPYKNAEISPRSCPNTPIRIFSARKIPRSGVREASDCEYSFTSWKKKELWSGEKAGNFVLVKACKDDWRHQLSFLVTNK